MKYFLLTAIALLTATAQRCAHANVTLINAAVSDCAGVAGMSIPTRTNGLSDYYQAHLIASRGGGLSVLTMPLDTMCQGHRIALVKIDVEGHEASVVSGMSPHRSVEARANRRNGIAGRDRSPRGDGVYR